jgi:cell division protein FtsW
LILPIGLLVAGLVLIGAEFFLPTVVLGFIGAVAVIGLFFLFIIFGIQTALGARDVFGVLSAGGITAWFGVQAIINIGGVTGAMPVTGLTLPFISYGGSSLLVTMAATGLLLNVARHMK